jgi:hypothetical protein
MEAIMNKVESLKITDKVRTVIHRLINRTQIEQTRDIIATLRDNGYGDAAQFIQANYPTR